MEQTIKEILANHSQLDIEEIDYNALLVDDLGLDSLDLAEIAMDIEDKFDITIRDDEFDWVTVQDIIIRPIISFFLQYNIYFLFQLVYIYFYI